MMQTFCAAANIRAYLFSKHEDPAILECVELFKECFPGLYYFSFNFQSDKQHQHSGGTADTEDSLAGKMMPEKEDMESLSDLPSDVFTALQAYAQ